VAGRAKRSQDWTITNLFIPDRDIFSKRNDSKGRIDHSSHSVGVCPNKLENFLISNSNNPRHCLPSTTDDWAAWSVHAAGGSGKTFEKSSKITEALH